MASERRAWPSPITHSFSTMNPSTLAARLADLQARSAASDLAAAAALSDLQATGQQLAAAMAALASEMEPGQ